MTCKITMFSKLELLTLTATWTWTILFSQADCLDETPCPQSWVLYEAQPVCIKLFTHPMNWTRAREVCQQEEGGDLAQLEDAGKMAFIEKMWLPPRKKYWIGVSDLDADGVFEFVNGVQVKDLRRAEATGNKNDNSSRPMCMLHVSRLIPRMREDCLQLSPFVCEAAPNFEQKCLDADNYTKDSPAHQSIVQTMTLETHPLAQRHELDSQHISALIEMTCNATLTGVCQSVASFQWKVDCYDKTFGKVIKVVEMDEDDYYPAATTQCQATKHAHLKEEWTRCNLKVTCCLCLADAEQVKRLKYLDTRNSQAKCMRHLMCLERFLRGAEAVLGDDDFIDSTLRAKRALISGLVYLSVGLLLVTFYKHKAIMALVIGKEDTDDDGDDDVADNSDTETAKRALRLYQEDSSDATISV